MLSQERHRIILQTFGSTQASWEFGELHWGLSKIVTNGSQYLKETTGGVIHGGLIGAYESMDKSL